MACSARFVLLIGSIFMLAATADLGGGQIVSANTSGKGRPNDIVRLQLKWVPQAQFAGYYLAQAKGFYAAQQLDVQILPGSADVAPEPVVASGQAEFGVDWIPSLLASREAGLNLQNIAQIFQRSGTTEITWKDSGITSIDGLRGRQVAVWCCGNQFELYAALRKAGIDPEDPNDIHLVDQPFDMGLFLNHQVDAAAAETYNELAQVLETVNPATGQLYSLNDLNVLDLEDAGAGMLQDGIFVDSDWLSDPRNQDIAVRFLRASFEGWMYCRDHEEECVQDVLANGPTLGAGHQRWMMNEINALIWPSSNGIGMMDPSAYLRTAGIALDYGVIDQAATDSSYRTDLAQQALAGIDGDVWGLNWQKATVEVTPGGQ